MRKGTIQATDQIHNHHRNLHAGPQLQLHNIRYGKDQHNNGRNNIYDPSIPEPHIDIKTMPRDSTIP